MVKFKIISEVHISLPVGVIEQVFSPRRIKASFLFEVGGGRLPQYAGPLFLPKIQAIQNHWNSGLAKARKGYANGDLVVVRNYSSKGGQSKTLPSIGAGFGLASNNLSNSLYGLKPYIGKYTGLFQPVVYKIAYEKIKDNLANTILGVDKQTLAGIDLLWIDKTITAMKIRNFQFKPALRKSFSGSNGKLRPLGIPPFKDKVVLQAMRLLLEPLFEPEFLDCSYGFRPGRSIHDALRCIRQWSGVTWVIGGCLGDINYSKLAKLLEKKVKNKNLIDLYWKAVKADYIHVGQMEFYGLSEVFQEGILSPLLSNVYLHELDVYVTNTLIPEYSTEINMKDACQTSTHMAALYELNKVQQDGCGSAIWKGKRHQMSFPSGLRVDTKIRYVRYADDWIIALNSSYEVAQQIRLKVRDFLKLQLDFDLCEEKTKITHLPSDKVKFLGTYIRRHNRLDTSSKYNNLGQGQISSLRLQLEAPTNLLVAKLAGLGYYDMQTKRPQAITKWIYMKPEEIITRYNVVIRSYVNYYSFVDNKYMMRYIMWILEYSLVFTLCRKWNISVPKLFKKLGKNLSYKFRNKTYKLERPNLTPTPFKFVMIGKSIPPGSRKLKYL
uniref:Reverse transcriptase domain-containing protein n=1 Tax=Protohalopteris sp. TaxID=2843287 RepID=A0A8F0FD05_9PHAE|nr:hypothetical protein [Protohalopteris sp.]